jgi:thioesterase domain-containing protein
VYILDAARCPVPIGVVGEIYIGGTPVGRGYLNRPELTAERFLRDPFMDNPNARMYRTGDLGRFLPDGSIEFRGRNDFQVKVRGFRIELDEIAAHLASLEGISDALVLAREDANGDKRLVAYYCGSEAPEPHVLRAHAAAALPDYMVPGAFVHLEALPITSNGKVDRNALPVPDRLSAPTAPYEAPSGALERAIAKIWCEALGLEQIGRHDDFFHLGGHSLKAVEVISRVQCELGAPAPLRVLFSHTTLADFASAIERAGTTRADASNVVCLRSYGARQPMFGIHPLGGTVEYLRLLMPHLDTQLPLYGLEASAWASSGSGTAPAPSIPDIAAKYVKALRAVQPKGPYRVLGYSVGGVIAYAMAEVLLAQAENIEFLGIIDTHPDLGGLPEFQALMSRIEQAEVEQSSAAADELFLQHVIEYLVAPSAIATVEQSLRSDSAPISDRSHVKLSGYPNVMRGAIRMMRATTKALCHYHPGPLPLRVDLFLAKDEVMFDLASAWKALIPNHVRTVKIPGSHLSLMEPQNITTLAFAITTGLAQARSVRAPSRLRELIDVSAYTPAKLLQS